MSSSSRTAPGAATGRFGAIARRRRRATTRLEAILALALLSLALAGAWTLQGPQIGATIRAMRERLFGSSPAPPAPSEPGAPNA